MQHDRTDPIRIELRRRNGDLAGVVLIDQEDAHLAERRWFVNNNGYAARNETIGRRENGRPLQRTVLMHRVLMGLEHGDGQFVDHINHDTLDNRRSNLRVVTHAENHQNRKAHGVAGTSSRFRGVSLRRDLGRWTAYATLNRQQISLGQFDSEEEAAEVAAAWRREHMPYATN